MYRARELFAGISQAETQCSIFPQFAPDFSRSAIIIEGRPLIGEALLHALRFTAPEIDLRLVKNIDDIDVSRPRIAVYNFVDRGCDAAFIQKAAQRLREKLPGFPLLIISDVSGHDREVSVDCSSEEHWISGSLGFYGLVTALRRAVQTDCSAPVRTQQPIVASQRTGTNASLNLECLTSKETSILRLLHDGKSNKFIAFEMKSSEGTVKAHISNMMRKLKVHNRTKLALMYGTHHSPAAPAA